MIIHTPDSAWAREATKWESQISTMGPGLRPYVKRDYPMMLHRAAQLASGGIEIVETLTVDDADHHRRMERNGFRATPLEAIEALTGQQLEYAKLAAEREWEKTHRLSPRAVAEVTAAEDEAGAVHLPTIDETPHGLRGEHVTSDREIALQAELDRLKAQLAAAPPVKKGWPKGKPRGARPKAAEVAS